MAKFAKVEKSLSSDPDNALNFNRPYLTMYNAFYQWFYLNRFFHFTRIVAKRSVFVCQFHEHSARTNDTDIEEKWYGMFEVGKALTCMQTAVWDENFKDNLFIYYIFFHILLFWYYWNYWYCLVDIMLFYIKILKNGGCSSFCFTSAENEKRLKHC